MKLKIERPDWAPNNGLDSKLINDFNDWFDQHVDPVNKLMREGSWAYGNYGHRDWYVGEPKKEHTHKSFMLLPQLIAKETAEDVLRDYIKLYGPTCGDRSKNIDPECFDLYDRAKAVLAESGERD